MPILKPVIPDDPFSPLAWNANLSILAIEKLSVGEALNSEERSSLEYVVNFATSILAAYHQKHNDLLSIPRDLLAPSLVASFCASADVNAACSGAAPPDFGDMLTDLRAVLEQSAHDSKFDSLLLERSQNACLALLNNANLHRPRPDQPHFVEF